MHLITVENGTVIVPDQSPCLPAPITSDFLDAVFNSEIGAPGHIANLHARITPADKDRFAQACQDLGGLYHERWCIAAVAYAAVAEADNVWRIRIMCSWEIYSNLITTLIADRNGFFYAAMRKGDTMSAVEFEELYGMSIAQHLREWRDHFSGRIDEVLVAVEEKWVHYKVTLATPDGIVTQDRVGPPNVAPRHWKYSPTEQFIDSERAP